MFQIERQRFAAVPHNLKILSFEKLDRWLSKLIYKQQLGKSLVFDIDKTLWKVEVM